MHNLVLPTDFSSHKDITLVVENLQNFVKRKVPIRFGLVPRTDSTAAVEQAKIVDHLLKTYGIIVTMEYLEQVCFLA